MLGVLGRLRLRVRIRVILMIKERLTQAQLGSCAEGYPGWGTTRPCSSRVKVRVMIRLGGRIGLRVPCGYGSSLRLGLY